MKLKVMKIIKIYLTCLLVVAFSSCAIAGKPKYSTNQLVNESPVGASTVTSFGVIPSPNAPNRITRKIRQDKEGNLLISAYKDIVQYDGKSFKTLKKAEGFESFDAFDALEDRKGNIWIASTNLGVFRYDGEAFSNFTIKDGLGHNRVMSLYEDKAGGIWIATQGGLSFYDGKYPLEGRIRFQNFTTKDELASDDVNTVLEDRTGKLWIGTRGALGVYDPSMPPESNAKTFNKIMDNEGNPFINVWSIIEDRKGNIWLSDVRGLWRYKNNSFTNYATTTRPARLYEDRKGNIWFTHGSTDSQKDGLSYFDQKSLLSENPKATQVHISDGMLFGISEAKDGGIWVGTLKGLFRYDGVSVNYFRDGLARD